MISAIKLPDQLWKIYLVIASVTILILCGLMPPFEVNDEFQHFFRSYQISDGIGIGRARDGIAGGYLPVSLSQLVLNIVGSLRLYLLHPVITRPIGQTLALEDISLNPQHRIFTDFSATVLYSPLGYLPQSLGMILARLFGAGPLTCFYAARIANGIFAVFITAYALRIAPFARYALFCTALLPTVLSLDGSVSQDASIISSIILFIALCLKSYDKKYWTLRDSMIATIMGLIFSVSKLAYAPLLILAFIPFLAENSNLSSRNAVLPSITLCCGIAASILWLFLSHPLMVWHQYNNYPDRQIIFVVAHPFFFLAVLFFDLYKFWFLYLRSSMTMFVGWPPEIAMPKFCFELIIFNSILLPISNDQSKFFITTRVRYLWLFLILVCGFSVLFLLYLSYEPVGGSIIEQAQGRHFIPLIPMVMTLISTIKISNVKSIVSEISQYTVVAFNIINCIFLIITVNQNYQPF